MTTTVLSASLPASRAKRGPSLASFIFSTTGEPLRHGDRILVDKYLWMRQDPERWQVAVFQYPLNRNKNFIKRLVGMPGDWMAIADGDILILFGLLSFVVWSSFLFHLFRKRDIDRVAQRLKGFRSRIYREDWIGQARDYLDQKLSGSA